ADDFADVQALAGLEREQDALPVLVAQCGIYLRNIAPFTRDGAHVVFIHNYIISYLVTSCQALALAASGADSRVPPSEWFQRRAPINSRVQPTPKPVVSD